MTWQFKNDKNLQSFLSMVGLSWEKSGDFGQATYSSNSCDILNNQKDLYNIKIIYHNNNNLEGSCFTVSPQEINNILVYGKFDIPPKVGQIWHVVKDDFINSIAEIKLIKSGFIYFKDLFYVRTFKFGILEFSRIWARNLYSPIDK